LGAGVISLDSKDTTGTAQSLTLRQIIALSSKPGRFDFFRILSNSVYRRHTNITPPWIVAAFMSLCRRHGRRRYHCHGNPSHLRTSL